VLGLAAIANIVEMPVDRLTVRFYHQLLQEYFAARQMLRQEPEKLAELWCGPWLEAEMPAWSRPENNYDPLPPPPPTGWEETTILAVAMAPAGDGRFLQALLLTNPVLAGRCLLQAQGGCDADLHQAVIAKLLAAVGDPDVALRVRIAAGNLLGFLGDPRSGEMTTIPAGKFLMGEGSEQHEVFLPDYRIGKYPVTNAEYRRFIDAGGYRDKSWWTDAGWLEIGQKQTEPRFWRDTRFNKPAQPVIGLSWYECVAYCRWLSSETGALWRLPTEAEWEMGARGSAGHLFPWGNEFDPDRLNGRGPRDRQVCTSTPVGIYPTGVSPFGLFDCVGNVWEWCATRWKKPFPYDTGHDEWQPDYLQGQNLRVLRGGSWYDTKEATRCTHRFKFQPYGWNDRGGFRLVSPA
jgi:formylglycine-generating enzyme required for sulfatase activity